MIHSVKLIKKEQQTTNKWAGGTTTQLAIYPYDGSYADRDFTWRLSSAVVELEESDFTKLPGFDRVLMVMDGKLKLDHEGHHERELNRFEQDSFKGGWNTTSYGKARDFNLMLKEGTRGSLVPYFLSENGRLNIELKEAEDIKAFYALYSHKCPAKVSAGKEEFELSEGALLLIEWSGDLNVSLQGHGDSEGAIITATILI